MLRALFLKTVRSYLSIALLTGEGRLRYFRLPSHVRFFTQIFRGGAETVPGSDILPLPSRANTEKLNYRGVGWLS